LPKLKIGGNKQFWQFEIMAILAIQPTGGCDQGCRDWPDRKAL
jgi:hypothetical protein